MERILDIVTLEEEKWAGIITEDKEIKRINWPRHKPVRLIKR